MPKPTTKFNMCGIIGVTKKNPEAIKKCLSLIRHRGPDGEGVFFDDNISLGHRRLAILDLSLNARQPMLSSDGNLAIVYNGEIYNFRALREDLIKKGYEFQSTGDTEVVLKGYSEYGIDFFLRMRGMWALAIYDKAKNCLVLARDFFGIKPLFYFIEKDVLHFASELKGLTPLISKVEPNKDYYFQLFNLGYFCAPETGYKNIKKLEPGEILVWDLAAQKVKNQEKINLPEGEIKTDYLDSFEQAADVLDEILMDSVKAHYVSDVPVGLLLSGGNDSSLIAALSVASGQKPIAYNLDIKNSLDSEYAEKVSQHLDLELVSLKMSEELLEKQYEKIWEIIDEPIAESSFIPTSLIYSSIASQTKVVLSGEGGDELFGGYRRYEKITRHSKIKENNRLINFFNMLASGNSNLALEFLNPALNRARNSMFDNFTNDIIGSYLINARIIDYPFEYRKLRKYLIDFFNRLGKNIQTSQPRLFLDNFLYLPNDLMYKNDLSSMAYSIEARVPFLDKEVFKTVASKIRPKYRLSPQFLEKKILKKVMEKYLPKNLIYRPKKGFSFSFKKYCFKSFHSDFAKALDFHQQNLDAFGLVGSGLGKVIKPENAKILIDKYPSFAFALVSNWKIFGR